jgi:hypothetical protein
MRNNLRVLLSVTPVPVVVVGLIWLNTSHAVDGSHTDEEKAAAQTVEIAQPSEWTAFVADFVSTTPGRPDLFGRYYRGSDGSFRVEQETKDGSLKYVAISNVPKATAYLFHSQRANNWVQRPMLLPPTGLRPRLRLSSQKGLTRFPDSVQGYEAYKYVGPDGSEELQVPALNFFSLYTRRASGRIEAYSNVRVGPLPATLFEPPGEAQIEVDERPIANGVSEKPPAKHQAR